MLVTSVAMAQTPPEHPLFKIAIEADLLQRKEAEGEHKKKQREEGFNFTLTANLKHNITIVTGCEFINPDILGRCTAALGRRFEAKWFSVTPLIGVSTEVRPLIGGLVSFKVGHEKGEYSIRYTPNGHKTTLLQSLEIPISKRLSFNGYGFKNGKESPAFGVLTAGFALWETKSETKHRVLKFQAGWVTGNTPVVMATYTTELFKK